MPSLFFKTIRTYVLWMVASPVFIVACCSIALLPSSWRYDSKLYAVIVNWWARYLMFVTFTSIRYKNKKHISRIDQEPVIFVMNHASALDIPIAEIAIGISAHIWLIKKEYGKIPVLGWLFRRMHVFVDRKSPRTAFLSLRKALDLTAKKKRHLCIFTEGTRSQTGEILPFMRGFAFLAKKLHRPVVPIYLQGVHKVLPKNAWLFRPHATTIEVTVGQPMKMQEGESTDRFVDRVQDWFSLHHES